MSSSNSPCAACKCRRQKCTQDCVFAPYFPPEKPEKFINVHNVFGAKQVAKILNELHPAQREDAVNSLFYEANYRLNDPVYGCVKVISFLQHKLKQIQHDLNNAKKEFFAYTRRTSAVPMFVPFFQHPSLMQDHHNDPSASAVMPPYNMQQPMMGLPTGLGAAQGAQMMNNEPQKQQQHEIYETQAQQFAEQQEMYRKPYQRQQQPAEEFTANGFNPMTAAAMSQAQPLALGSYETVPYHQILQQSAPENSQSNHHHPHQFQLQSQLILQQQEEQQQPAPENSQSNHHRPHQFQLQSQLILQQHEEQQNQPQASWLQPQRDKTE